METKIIKMALFAGILSLLGCGPKKDPSMWTRQETDTWFNKGKWLNGWNVTPDQTIDRKAVAVAYHKNPERWDAAFKFLKSVDLKSAEVKRHDIHGDSLYALVSEYNSKNPEDARYEAHRKYLDIQYVISGKELMGIGPMSIKDSVLQEYDPVKDIEFFTVKEDKKYPASPDRFFIFFPSDAHRPGVKDGENAPVKKVVIKLLLD